MFTSFFIFRHEAMSDLIYVLNQLVDIKGNILIPRINEDLEPLSEREKQLYEKIHFDVDTYIKEIGASKPLLETKVGFINLVNKNNTKFNLIIMYNTYFRNNC